MAKHMSLAKVMKMLKRQAEHQQTEAETNRLKGLNNPNGRHTYTDRLFRKVFNPGTGKCPGGCGRNTSIGRLCMSCQKTRDGFSADVVDKLRKELGV